MNHIFDMLYWLRWINQNPFRSLFWAVQGMAAELTTGALLMREIEEQKKPVSMLVIGTKASFQKKQKAGFVFHANKHRMRRIWFKRRYHLVMANFIGLRVLVLMKVVMKSVVFHFTGQSKANRLKTPKPTQNL